jgi:hypothetical protein
MNEPKEHTRYLSVGIEGVTKVPDSKKNDQVDIKKVVNSIHNVTHPLGFSLPPSSFAS